MRPLWLGDDALWSVSPRRFREGVKLCAVLSGRHYSSLFLRNWFQRSRSFSRRQWTTDEVKARHLAQSRYLHLAAAAVLVLQFYLGGAVENDGDYHGISVFWTLRALSRFFRKWAVSCAPWRCNPQQLFYAWCCLTPEVNIITIYNMFTILHMVSKWVRHRSV